MRVVLGLGFALCLNLAAFADEVVLKNGNVFRGRITEESDGKLVIESGGMTLTFEKSQVAQVVRTTPAPTPANTPGEGAPEAAGERPAVEGFCRAMKAADLGGIWDLLGKDPRAWILNWVQEWNSREGMDYDKSEALTRFFVNPARERQEVEFFSSPKGNGAMLRLGAQDLWRLTLGSEEGRTRIVDLVGPHASGPEGTDPVTALRNLAKIDEVYRQVFLALGEAGAYWTRDVAGLGFVQLGKKYGKLSVLPQDYARADRVALSRYTQDPPKPLGGYWFRSILRDARGDSYVTADSDRDGRLDGHPSRFAFCAYPAEYGGKNRLTYVVSEDGKMYDRDLGADAREGIEQWPGPDPAAAGWKRTP